MDWFKRLTGFVESTGPAGHEITRQKLELDGQRLRSRVNGRSYGIGQLERVSLATLRHRASLAPMRGRRNSFNIVPGNVRQLHAAPRYCGALFPVASQFNLLEATAARGGVARTGRLWP